MRVEVGGRLCRGPGIALQVYSAQHQNVTTAWADAFTAATGIKVQIRKGTDSSMGHQLVAEGRRVARPTCSSPRTAPR
jgi:iron(III) transport system substrate-binding protein